MFFYNFDRVGKGINPNTPKKTGFAWYMDILGREFWAMMWLNTMFLLYSIPIFTIGASTAAMNTVLLRMLRDKPVDAVSDFRDAFRANFKQSTVVFIIQIAVYCLLAINLTFYGAMSNAAHTLIIVFIAVFSFANLYVMPLLVAVELKIPHIFKNSFILFFLNGKYSLMTAVISGGICFLMLWFFPFSVLLLFLGGIVLPQYTNLFLTHYGIEKYCYPKTPEELEAEAMAAEAMETVSLDEEKQLQEDIQRLEAEEDALQKKIDAHKEQ